MLSFEISTRYLEKTSESFTNIRAMFKTLFFYVVVVFFSEEESNVRNLRCLDTVFNLLKYISSLIFIVCFMAFQV